MPKIFVGLSLLVSMRVPVCDTLHSKKTTN